MYLDHICSYAYPHLVDLMINPSIEESNTFINLILRHQQTLVSLSLHGVTTEALEAIEVCSKLQQLQFTSLILTKPKQWVSLHDQLWSRLKKLCAGQSRIPLEFQHVRPLEIPPELPISSASIQELTFSIRSGRDKDTIKTRFWTVQWCPHLVQLSWSTFCCLDDDFLDADSGPMRLMSEEIRSGGDKKWVYIKNLHLSGWNIYSRDLSLLIRSMPQLTALNLSHTDINLDDWIILQRSPRLLIRLRELVLEDCYRLPGSAIQDMLCMMPNLEVFKTPILSYTEVEQDDRP